MALVFADPVPDISQADKTISITVKAMPEGFLSTHLVNGPQPGTIVRLAALRGEFVLPDPLPEKILFATAVGSPQSSRCCG